MKHLLVLLLLSYIAATQTLFAQSGTTQPLAPSGTGTSADPFLISNLANLRWLSEVCPSGLLSGTFFSLTGDIDASETASWNPNGTGFDGFHPVGTFNGTFLGNNHAISNLYIRNQLYTGLFRFLNSSAVISGLRLTNVTIQGGFWTGAFAGESRGYLYNCASSGQINTTGMITGGIIGNNYGKLIYCSSSCIIVSTNCVAGGIAGIHATGTIRYCSATGAISGSDTIGGLVGENDSDGNIGNCFSACRVINGGGLFGYLGPASNPYQCFSYGAADYGFAYYCNKPVASVLRCYFNSDSCTSAAPVKATAGVSGLTTAQFTSSGNFQLFDFPYVWTMGSLHPEISATTMFPIDFPLQGDGIPELPYLISTLSDLKYFDDHINLSHSSVKLTADIDATASRTWNLNGGVFHGFSPIGDYTGVFDGNNMTISGLYINRPESESVGLFSGLSGGSVKNLVLEGLTVIGGYSTGAIAGYSYGGNILDCSVSGFVSGTGNSGGLAGYFFSGTIRHCRNRSLVLGQPGSSFGGLAGYVYTGSSQIDHCTGSGRVYAGPAGSSAYLGTCIGLNFYGYLQTSFFDKETADTTLAIGYNLNGIPYSASALTTAAFLLNSSFSSWSGSWGTTFQAPWQQPNGKTRPWLWFEQVVVSNGKFVLYDNQLTANGYVRCISGGPVTEVGFIINNTEEPWYNVTSSRIFPQPVNLADGANATFSGVPVGFPYLTPGDDYYVTSYAKTGSGRIFYGDVTYVPHVLASPPPAQLSLGNITVAGGQDQCFNATQTITVAGTGTTFEVQNGATVRMIAGQRIRLLEGMKVDAGGNFHGSITTTNSWCYASKGTVADYFSETVQDSGSVETYGIPGPEIRVFPNPTDGDFTLQLTGIPGGTPATIRCYDMTGRLILEQETRQGQDNLLSIGLRPRGIYLLRVNSCDRTFTARIIRE